MTNGCVDCGKQEGLCDRCKLEALKWTYEAAKKDYEDELERQRNGSLANSRTD